MCLLGACSSMQTKRMPVCRWGDCGLFEDCSHDGDEEEEE